MKEHSDDTDTFDVFIIFLILILRPVDSVVVVVVGWLNVCHAKDDKFFASSELAWPIFLKIQDNMELWLRATGLFFYFLES